MECGVVGKANPTVYLFAGCRMAIHGGGSTCAQIARAYVRAGYNVIFLSPESPVSPVTKGGIVEVRTDRCDYGRIKYEVTEDDILHIALPCVEAERLLEDFGGHALYHCRDNWDVWYNQSKHAPRWHWYVPGLEVKLINVVDISYAVSPVLQAYADTDDVLSNAYDPTIFKWVDHKPPVQRAVMWGFSGGHTNLSLIGSIAQLTPDVEYVLIGKDWGTRRSVTTPANVRFLGPMRIEALPAIAAESDVGLVLRHGIVAKYMCPIKSWEYLGSGLRFVSAGYDYPNSDYNPACTISPSTEPQDVADTIRNVYELIPKLTEEQAVVHTWDNRVEKILADLGIRDK